MSDLSDVAVRCSADSVASITAKYVFTRKREIPCEGHKADPCRTQGIEFQRKVHWIEFEVISFCAHKNNPENAEKVVWQEGPGDVHYNSTVAPGA